MYTIIVCFLCMCITVCLSEWVVFVVHILPMGLQGSVLLQLTHTEWSSLPTLCDFVRGLMIGGLTGSHIFQITLKARKRVKSYLSQEKRTLKCIIG